MPWGRQRYFKQCRKQQAIFKFRQDIANAAGVPVEYITGRNLVKSVTSYYFNKVKELNKICLDGFDNMTKRLPRKKKKQLRKIYNWMRKKHV